MGRIWTLEELPIPYLQDRTQYVSNPDLVLQQATVDSINLILNALEIERGVQSLIVVVNRVEGGDSYEFGMKLARKYGIGDRKTRTGLIIVLAKTDRSYYFLTGNGLEATLPDALIQRIEDRLFLPRLKVEDWDGAMLLSIKAIDSICRGDASLTRSVPPSSSEGEGWFSLFVLSFLFLAFAGIAYYGHLLKKRPKTCPRCSQKSYYYIGETRGYVHKRRQRYIVVTTSYHCRSCSYRGSERHENLDRGDWHTALLIGALFSRGGSWRSGGGFSGGSFGGGSFGGGGSGGRF